MSKEIERYFTNADKWKIEIQQLREICLSCNLSEELKWSKPCYTYRHKNIVLIQAFKNYCALLFFKGYLLTDPERILVKTGTKTRIGRQVRFTGKQQPMDLKDILVDYILEAVDIEK